MMDEEHDMSSIEDENEEASMSDYGVEIGEDEADDEEENN
jgi:hypothetical protein